MGSNARIGFQAAYLVQGGKAETTGVGNALVGADLNQLGLPERAVIYITMSPPESVNWLDRDKTESVGIDVTELEAKPTPQPGLKGRRWDLRNGWPLLVEAPEQISKTKIFTGSVVWRVERTHKAAGQPPMILVKADIEGISLCRKISIRHCQQHIHLSCISQSVLEAKFQRFGK